MYMGFHKLPRRRQSIDRYSWNQSPKSHLRPVLAGSQIPTDMTSEIESAIEASQHQAESHAAKCRAYILSDQLVEAIEYCKTREIEPPQCSLTAQSPNPDIS